MTNFLDANLRSDVEDSAWKFGGSSIQLARQAAPVEGVGMRCLLQASGRPLVRGGGDGLAILALGAITSSERCGARSTRSRSGLRWKPSRLQYREGLPGFETTAPSAGPVSILEPTERSSPASRQALVA